MELQTFGLHLLLLTLCLVSLSHAQEEVPKPSNKTGKAGRAISVFQVVRFPNDACTGSTGGKNGTCYTAAECSAQGGTNAGTCAAGYGVCCTFSIKCGGVATQNCSYFESTGTEIGQCAIKVCKCYSNICQIRLDFNTFSITGPSTSAATTTVLLNGQSTASPNALFQRYTPATECLTDLFTVTNPGGAAPPTICGTNTGQHMYVDANDLCNTLGFELSNAVSTTGAAAAISTRSWSIKITQYDCSYNNLAPEGCTQYYYGATSACVTSYNYNNANGVQLANQNQNICVRKERDFCKICWTTTPTATTDFQISGTQVGGIALPSKCCGYGATANAAIAGTGFDCITIPGASKVTAAIGVPNGVPLTVSRFCGKSSLRSVAAITGNKSICSSRQPFQLRFLSDNGEVTGEVTATSVNKGFRLCYIESNSNC